MAASDGRPALGGGGRGIATFLRRHPMDRVRDRECGFGVRVHGMTWRLQPDRRRQKPFCVGFMANGLKMPWTASAQQRSSTRAPRIRGCATAPARKYTASASPGVLLVAKVHAAILAAASARATRAGSTPTASSRSLARARPRERRGVAEPSPDCRRRLRSGSCCTAASTLTARHCAVPWPQD